MFRVEQGVRGVSKGELITARLTNDGDVVLTKGASQPGSRGYSLAVAGSKVPRLACALCLVPQCRSAGLLQVDVDL